MAGSKRRRSMPAAEQAPAVTGAVPYKPKMTKAEVLDEIEKVSGTPATLSDLRPTLPTARAGRPAPVSTGARGAGGTGRRKIASRATKAAPASLAALTNDERLLLIDQAMLMLQEVYAHLPLKRALHAIDPIQRLQLLRLRQDALDEREFQSEILDIFVSLRDLHTNYTLPKTYWPNFAFLPFRVEEYYADGERKYLVSWVSPQNTDPKLKAGVEITHWNGSPIDLAVARNVLRFGEFTLKSGRVSPYFFNAGLFDSGAALATLGRAYAEAATTSGIAFDMLFGPAYKGIVLAALTASALAERHARDVPFAYNRKEAKNHGEGGLLVGAPLRGRVLIVDDVITAGTAIRESVDIIRGHGATPAAVLIALDRQERGAGERSAVQEVEATFGLPVISVLKLADLACHLEASGDSARLAAVQEYRARYGVLT